jgi:glycine betaine/proline transport system substrate-binding protein
VRTGERLLALAATLLVCSGSAQAQGTVTLGQISISFYAVTGQVVQAVLERLGHTVKLVTGSHAQIFPELGRGNVDLLVAAWLPSGHAQYWEQHGKEAVELTTLYRGARLFWAVPSYVPVDAVTGVEDLSKPDIAARMVKRIRGTGPDSGLMIGSRRIMQAYELETAGYELLPGKHEQWNAYFEDNYRHKRWFVMPYFRPNYLNRIAEMRMLEERFEFLGGDNNGVLVAHRNFIDRVPARTVAVLRKVNLDLDTVAEMDYAVQIEGSNPREAALDWMARNASRVESWFAD